MAYTDISEQDEDRAPERGRQATAPQRIPPEGWIPILKRVFASLGEDRVMLTAAGVTYYTLLALVPALTALVSIYGLFADRATVLEHVGLLAGIVPEGGLDIISEQLERIAGEGATTLGWTLVVSLGIALWGASAGIRAMFEAMNVAYGEREKRNFIVLNTMVLLSTLLVAVCAALVIGAVVLLPAVTAFLEPLPSMTWLLRLAGYGVFVLILVCGLAALYRWGPSRTAARWRWITPGAVIATLGTLAVSIAFSWYVANFGNYGATYGSLGALIGFLTWIWLSVTLVILGAELNAEIEHQTARDTTTGPAQPMGERGAHVADTLGE